MQHRHGHAAWTMDMHHGHVHTCSMVTDMQYRCGHEHTALFGRPLAWSIGSTEPPCIAPQCAGVVQEGP
jgi:hypothetical protein